MMEAVACPLCNEDKGEFLWSKQGARYFRCPACSLVYENPRLSFHELKEFYSQESYFVNANASSPTSGYQDYFSQCSQALQSEYFGIVERYSKRKPGRYLDIGCGPGGVLRIAKEHGWEAVGLEISSWAVKEGRKAGLHMIEATLLDAGFGENQFDAISMFDVLEHLSSPLEYMRETLRVLRPGGVLVIETPNVDGFFTRYWYRERADLVKPRAHICLYGPSSARRLLRLAGFRDFHISAFPYCRKLSPGYLKSVVVSRLAPGPPVQLTLNDSLRIVCWK
jgi:SAM-dependent methyltransferase